MGQLERYGLYVLCLVIFLILGIAIWGDSPQPMVPPDTGNESLEVTGKVGSGDNISDAQRKELEEEANVNRVIEFIKPRPQQEEAPYSNDLPLTKVRDADQQTQRTPLPTPTPPPAPKLRTHVVKEFETLEEISLRYLGTRHRWRRILDLNPNVRERALRPGTKLKIPPRETAKGAALAVPGTVIVRRGDSLGLISQRLFGTARYANDIMRLNNIEDPRKLMPGTVLKIPKVDPRKTKKAK
ncbi:MAG: LysM peptidoglycan-binding domain-containing protein [Planctomycetota bacterium]|jgi:nucleoid-associated protein YgaU